MVVGRAYTPEPAGVSDYRDTLAGLGIERTVLVQPSVYGTDNRCLLDTMPALGLQCRAIVALHPRVTEAEIASLHAAGARGARCNVLVPGGGGLDALFEIADRIAPFGWHLDINIDPDRLDLLESRLDRIGLPVVLDHMANIEPRCDGSGLDRLLGVLAGPAIWVKISSIYRLSRRPPPHDDLRAVAERIMEAAPERIVWGSDWPHPLFDDPVDEAGELETVLDWCGDDAMRQRVFCGNPARLFGFANTGAGSEPISDQHRQGP
jgi:predicted TIM-barrel fold metal-dependent hydrolase